MATLVITHFNKNVNGRVMSRIIDSMAFVGLPRVVIVAFKKHGNGSLIMCAKIFIKILLMDMNESPAV